MREWKIITNLVPALTSTCVVGPVLLPPTKFPSLFMVIASYSWEQLATNPRVISHLGNLRGQPQICHSTILPNQMHLPVAILIQHLFLSPPRDAKNCHVDGGGLSRDIPAEQIKVKQPLNPLLGANSTCQKTQ